MKFNEYKYEHLDLEKIKKEFSELIKSFEKAENVEGQVNAFDEIIKLRNHIETMQTLVSVRHSIDTNDEFYDKENEYMDEISPILFGFTNDFYKALVNSKFKDELIQKYGKFLFDLAENTLKTFSPEIIPDAQEENRLSSKYSKLIASAKIDFDGKELNLSQMVPYTQSKDRNVRIEAAKKVAQFFSENQDEFDDIYDSLVKVRTRMAQKMGYKNFVEFGYKQLSRLEYDAKMVEGYRKQVLENIVPLHTELRERQGKRLGVDKLKFYDEAIKFNSGNADPHGSPEWILNNGKTMYKELSKETDEFFTFMTENNLLDLQNPPEYVKILLLRADARYAGWNDQDCRNEASRLIRRIKDEYKKQKKELLTAALRDAEDVGDDAKTRELLKKIQALNKEIYSR